MFDTGNKMISRPFSYVFTSSHRVHRCSISTTAISVPNLRNGYGMRRREGSEKAREGEQGIMRRRKKGKRWLKQEF
jgi:hypothetical protein